jgi:hypothetical protein
MNEGLAIARYRAHDKPRIGRFRETGENYCESVKTGKALLLGCNALSTCYQAGPRRSHEPFLA